MSKILLINSPIRESQPPTNIPYGLSLIAAVLDKDGQEVVLLDANAYRLSVDEIIEEIKDEDFDLIGLSGLVTTYRFQKKLASKLRIVSPKSLIISGGGCATSIPHEMLTWIPEIDLCGIGEGEKTILDIIAHIGDRDFTDVLGIVYRDQNGKIIENPKRPLMTPVELDQLPYPALDMLPMEDVYFKNSSLAVSREAFESKRRVDIISERGCPWGCTFCFHNVGGRKVRYQSPKYVVEMIKHFRFKYAIDFVTLIDENMLANKKRAMEFCDLYEEAGLADIVKWGSTGHPNTIDPDILPRLKECGCTYLEIGGESADNRILKEIKKNTTVDKLQRALDLTLKVGINPVMNFMVGYEGEDLQSIYRTTKFWIKNGFQIFPFIITPYPGSELYYKNMDKILEQYDGKLENFILALGDATELTVNISTFSDPELLGLRDLMAKQDLVRIKRFAKEKNIDLDE
ncbi:MAG: B12-binding domain-containing radical SAM protein [Candidatus Heimdallarchaeota archaeon]|nr:B12-binding domain-containing radical SAM protein [Candidatus Heimdallarchaeota archaeon]